MRDYEPSKDHVIIDRTTKWGNPFKLVDYNNDRDLVLNKFEEYFHADQKLQQAAIEELSGKILVCWCKPKKCHGDVYARFVNENMLFN